MLIDITYISSCNVRENKVISLFCGLLALHSWCDAVIAQIDKECQHNGCHCGCIKQRTVSQNILHEGGLVYANSVGTLVISDDLYHTIAEQSVPATKILSINGKSIEDNEALFQALKGLFPRIFCMRADLYTSVPKTQSASPNKNGMPKKAAVCF